MDNSASAQKKALRTFKYQVDTLAQFLVRLSAFYHGAQPELDQELIQLRKQLGGKLDFSKVENSISRVTGLMMAQSETFRSANQQAEHLLHDTLDFIGNQPNLPDPLTQELNGLTQHLEKTPVTLSNSVSLFQRAIQIQKKMLELLNQHSEAESDGLPLDSRPPVFEEILYELRSLLAHLKAKRVDSEQIQVLESQLNQGLNEQQLLECCLAVLRTLFKDVHSERLSAESFVNALQQHLSGVSEQVNESIEESERRFEEKQANTEAMRDHVKGMESALQNTNNLNQLKSKSQDYLAKMAQSLTEREQHDTDDQFALMSLLSDMRKQLVELEQETRDYRQKLEQLKFHSQHDALTRLPNRNAFNTRMDQEFHRWQRNGSSLSMVLIDVDHFKSINDNYGHKAGDKTLQVMAQQINKCLRTSDFMARWGGEEFIVLLPDTDTSHLQVPMEKIRQRVERIPFRFKNQQVTITVSVGATQFTEGDTIESVFERADQALYQAKSDGRNRSCIIEG